VIGIKMKKCMNCGKKAVSISVNSTRYMICDRNECVKYLMDLVHDEIRYKMDCLPEDEN
jgi:hypothetical protein